MTTLIFPRQSSNESFGSLVVAMRHAVGLGQATLAERAGCSPSHLSNIEHVRSAPPTEKLARRLAQGMGLTLSETKAFVAEANLARSQWHAERVRSRTRGRDEEGGASATVLGNAPYDRAAAKPDFQSCTESLRHGVASSATWSPASGLFRDCDVEGDGRVETPRCQAGAFWIAAKTVRFDVDLPQIGAACLEIDVATLGSDCRLLMRVVPRTLEAERRP